MRINTPRFFGAVIGVTFVVLAGTLLFFQPFGETTDIGPDLDSSLSLSTASKECPRVYAVQGGDTVFQIANNFGVSGDHVLQANGIRLPAALKIGETIYIPCAGQGGLESENDEEVDDRPQINVIARFMNDCIAENIEVRVTERGCMTQMPTEPNTTVIGQLEQTADSVRRLIRLDSCVAHHNLAAAAYIRKDMAELTLSEEYQASLGEDAFSARMIIKVQLSNVGASWLLARVKYGLVDKIPLNGGSPLSC